ncbi:MAG: SGNH/GDSL hydrolase family protein [Mucilaginibacter sp.]
MSANSRRSFFKQAAAIGVAVSLPKLVDADDDATSTGVKGLKILFQGDSITDGNRTRDNDRNHIMGHGYAYLIASRLGYDHPERQFHFYNRGISGNKVPDLDARWQTDTLGIKPDILSILIGVNDAQAALNDKANTAELYEKGYRDLLQQTKTALPGVVLVICEPFILPVGRVKADWENWHRETAKRQAIAKALATEFNAVFVGLQDKFNEALEKASADYWMWDGIHPMPAGHELIAREWLKAVKKGTKLV